MTTKLTSATEAALDDIENANQQPETSTDDTVHANESAQHTPSDEGRMTSTEPSNAETTESEKTFTKQQVEQMISARVASSKAQSQRLEKELQHLKTGNVNADSGNQTVEDTSLMGQGNDITLSRDDMEQLINNKISQNEEQRIVGMQVNALDSELKKARDEDAEFNTLCEQVPPDLAEKYFLSFAGEKDAVPAIKTILQNTELAQQFAQCTNPMKMAHILGRAYGAVNNTPNKTVYKADDPLYSEGAKKNITSISDDASLDSIESELYG